MHACNKHTGNYLLMLAALVVWGAGQSTASAGEQSTQEAAQWQSHDSIRAAAQAHAEASFNGSGSGSQTRIQAANLDSRLRLPACAEPLRTESPYGQTRGNRVTVRVSCPGEKTWRIHVPVEIVTLGSVVATARALARGSVLTREDLALTRTQLGQLGHGYFLDPTNVVGQRLKRPMPAGSVLTPAQLEAPAAIKRGQNVTIVANSRGIGIKMNGTALQNGAIGQIIDIENTSSGKRVQGVVRSARAVEILLR